MPATVAMPLSVTGTVRIEQVNVALFWSASLGGGTLSHKGQSYDFVVGGLGVGGVGASSLKATGEVYDMGRVTDFEGVYGQARVGYASPCRPGARPRGRRRRRRGSGESSGCTARSVDVASLAAVSTPGNERIARRSVSSPRGPVTRPTGAPAEAARSGFRVVRGLVDELGLRVCSMGMTGDVDVALEEGSTEIRVGTALFGPRPPRS